VDRANNEKLIRELRGVPAERRTARFRCALALADGGRILATAEGAIEGVIIDEPRGGGGFGYDPHFFVPSLGRTTAELAAEDKNRISHRGQALRAMRSQLVALLVEGQ
jgi:XTP/dITP diphosphohydrolase